MERFLETLKPNGCPSQVAKLILMQNTMHYNPVRGRSYNNYLLPNMAENKFNATEEPYSFTCPLQ